MLVEIATFEVLSGDGERFETVFAAVGRMLAGSPGYSGHRLLRDVNESDRYVLIVDWRDGDGGVSRFRQSGRLEQARTLLAPFHRVSPSLACLTDVDDEAGDESPWKSHYAD